MNEIADQDSDILDVCNIGAKSTPAEWSEWSNITSNNDTDYIHWRQRECNGHSGAVNNICTPGSVQSNVEIHLKWVRDKMTWPDSLSKCQDHNGTLFYSFYAFSDSGVAETDKQLKQFQFLAENMRDANENFADFWVGVMKAEDHTSKSSDGFSIDMPARFWDYNRPNHSNDENCICVHAAKPGGISGVGYFKDIKCENNLPSVCHVKY